jgi:hypothetical protein
MLKLIDLNNFEVVKIIRAKTFKFLVLKSTNKNTQYFTIPSEIIIFLKKKQLCLDYVISNENKRFICLLSNYLSKKKFKHRLRLKGLGYKMLYNKDNNLLEFKLGFSHIKRLKVSSTLTVQVFKNYISLESDDKVTVGNFAAKIVKFKSRDIYKGKGFWFKYQKENLKTIKKK